MKTGIYQLFIVFAVIGVAFFASCNKETIVTVSGKVQKGPYIIGSSIMLNELDENLNQTGRAFTSTIVSDDGSFNLGSITLESEYVLLTAEGYYFSEIYGSLSPSTLRMQAIADASNSGQMNVNAMTHVLKDRVMYLVSEGQNFEQANQQAKSELLSFLNASEASGADFVNYDIAGNNTNSAVLLAFSLILQRYTPHMNGREQLTAELSSLLANLSSDFRTDGIINNRALIDTLLYNAYNLNFIQIENNIAERYSDLGLDMVIPDFVYYIDRFVDAHAENLSDEIIYPASVCSHPIYDPNTILPNILVPGVTEINAGWYSMLAIIPSYTNLTVKFIYTGPDENFNPIPPYNYGWYYSETEDNGFIITAERHNSLIDNKISFANSGTATMEYYINGETSPSLVKQITWQ